MRKLICCLAVLFMLFQSVGAYAESIVMDESSASVDENAVLSPVEIALLGRPKAEQPTHLTVGNPTMVSGSFFTDMWGNNTSDIDVRTLLHGYNTVEWSSQLQFVTDPMVVSNLTTGRSGRNALYTVTLQQDLTYCDGVTPITAKDYVFSLLLCTSSQAAALGAESSRYAQIVGYDEYHSGKAKALSGVRLVDEYTFSIAVKAAYEPFFYDLANLWCIPYPRSVLAPYCDVQDTKKGVQLCNVDPENPDVPFTVELLKQTIFDETQGYMHFPRLTSGPYQMTAYDKATGKVDFAINPYYKGNFEGVKPLIDTLTLVPVVPETMMAMLRDGQVDLINKCVDGSLIQQGIALRDAGFEARNYARLGYAYCALACEKGPQQFAAVRQALAYCIDKDFLVNDFLQGFGIAVHGYYGMGQWMLLAANGTLRPDAASDKELAAWDTLTLDALNPYPQDLTEAKRLLVKSGWTLNAKGKKYVEGVDDVRYKKVDGQLMRLSIRFAQAQNSVGAQMVSLQLAETWPQIGGELIVEEVPFTELLADFYRKDGDRKYDMNFMGTNFTAVFDPYLILHTEDDIAGSMNTSGLRDPELMQLAWKMRKTEPLDLLAYEKNWLKFQTRFNAVLPTIPLYSNVYFDFFTDRLQNYEPNAYYSWPTAILYAYVAEPGDTNATEGKQEVVEN